jgi:two-component system chemotaxis response regulator CheB
MNANGQLALHAGTALNLHIPAIDQLFASLALQAKVGLAVLLTGMGEDGASALRALRDRGWQTFAQDAESAVVHGMPGVAIALGAAAHVLSPAAIGKYLSSQYLSSQYHYGNDPAGMRKEAR